MASKEDISRLRTNMAAMEGHMETRFATLDSKMTVLFWMFGILLGVNGFLSIFSGPIAKLIK